MSGFLSLFRKPGSRAVAPKTQGGLALALAGGVKDLRPPPMLAPPPPPLPPPPSPQPIQRARLVFAFDATGSRQAAWSTSGDLTAALLSVMPGHLDIALAVHGGSELHTWIDFVSDIGQLQACVARIDCLTGVTRLLAILARALDSADVSTVVYVGDDFEENEAEAVRLAQRMAQRDIRLIILHENTGREPPVFQRIAAMTGGCVLPFDTAALPKMKDLLAAVAVLTVGGTKLLTEKQAALPGARHLLTHIKGSRAMGGDGEVP